MNVLEASGLGKRYGSTQALRDCSLAIPEGHVTALVGPNGAGKSTLLNLAVGLSAPSEGSVAVLGGRPPGSAAALDGIAFVAQDTPLYKSLSAADMLHLTRNLNRHFDQPYAEARLADFSIPLKRKAGRLSGGQQAQLALTLALARRPHLLVLDEPVAMLDPIARHDFMATVLTAAADDGVSVLLSSHVLAELERVADYLIVMSKGRVQVAGEVDDLLAGHRVLSGPAAEAATYAEHPVVHVRKGEAQAHLLVRATADDPVPVGFEGACRRPGGARAGVPPRTRRHGVARTGPQPRPRRIGGVGMTALSTLSTTPEPTRSAEAASLRPLPWRRMAWVTWRQHRTALIGVLAFIGALALCLLLVGLHLHQAYAAATACHPAGSAACNAMAASFNGIGNFLSNGSLLQLVPPLIGAFIGAPLLAREFEAGTFRFAWTQGFGRARWTLAKLVALGVAVVAASGALSALAAWYYQPYFASSNQALSLTELNSLAPGLFNLRGVGLAAWTLAAFSIGALAGTLIRRVVPAIVATLVVYAGLAFAAGGWLRMHYLTPLVTKGLDLPASAQIVSQWGTRGGRVVFTGPPTFPIYQQYCPAAAGLGKGGGPSAGNPLQCLAQHGFTLWTSYQPASRFWAFQWIEGGWLLVLSVLLIAVTVWLVRRRAA